ncbi:hybrid sensor histidine kinase/response regulator [Caulobacter radicis]|uniref:sensor histidine kinase n=1 Tax=Caulobacter radicis TaxID=2172650 RepID=UPI000D569223|nr:ATP-binding protein [Caulobacter radicis]PVM86791.1 hybrid sensor histidine kinase/response regulator [Caulobacter radicis]
MPQRPFRFLDRRADRPAASNENDAGWLRYRHLKVEAVIFLLVLVTFAAVLGKSALTRQALELTPGSTQFAGYAFADDETGGRSTVTPDPDRPMAWSCEIRAGVTYPYCGYGLLLNLGSKARGLDFSRFQTLTLRLYWRGEADRLKVLVKTAPPAALRGRLGDLDVPLATEVSVSPGANTIVLPLDRLEPEQWWLTSHGLSRRDVAPAFSDVRAIAVAVSGAQPGRLAASMDSVRAEGVQLSDEQWYLIILGVWLVMIGAFLVHRLLGMRRDFETRQRQQADEALALSDARIAAETANAAKSQFLSHMSHELRTPLNAVIGYSYWLSRGNLDPKQRTAVDAIRSSGEHLLAVITDILDLAKIEAGKLDLQPVAFDLATCLAELDQMFRLRAEEKNLDFAVAMAPEVPSQIVADPKRLRQVLINLLGNAVKFTDAGSVTLRVERLEGEAGQTARLRFTVEDTGVGIASDQLDAIFRPFEQVGDASRHAGGTGLGLSITRQIVETMGGTIGVDSTLGRGSRFVVEASVGLTQARRAPQQIA